MLYTSRSGSGRTVVLVHGFTQTGRSWDRIASGLARRFEVVRPDLPGHGGSGEVEADLPTAAALVGASCGPGTYVGYSLGGRVALHLALQDPGLVERLVLLSTSPGIEDPAERAARRDSDEALARTLEDDGLDAFLERWLALPLFARLHPAEAGVADRRRNTVAGLASSLRLCGTGTMDPSLWDRLGDLTMPTLVVAGAEDEKFRVIAERMAAAIPDAELAVVAGAGHAAHLEQPDAIRALVEQFAGS